MKKRRGSKAAEALELRRKAFDNVKEKRGHKRPGSRNGRK